MQNQDFKTLSGSKIVLDDSATVFVFLNTECPVCQKYQGAFKTLQTSHPSKKILYIFPGKQAQQAILDFCAYDNIQPSQVIPDTDYRLSRYLHATVTPQAIITKNGKTQYSGKIDDRFANIGSSGSNSSVNFVDNALFSLSRNEEVRIAHTEPVGCFIEPR